MVKKIKKNKNKKNKNKKNKTRKKNKKKANKENCSAMAWIKTHKLFFQSQVLYPLNHGVLPEEWNLKGLKKSSDPTLDLTGRDTFY